jgi:hypothetical protein
VESEQSPGLGWPYLSFSCHSNDLPLGVHYRVTIQHPLRPSAPAPATTSQVDAPEPSA